MNLRVLGCSGGIGADLRTTSLLIDDDILIDAGSGVGDLTLEELENIKHIFLTHTHMDHFIFLPLMVDSIFGSIKEPVIVHGQPKTIEALKTHIFNWTIWPDFSKLPTVENPVMAFETMLPGATMTLNGRTLEMIQVNHIVPGVGYRVECDSGSFAFTGDTTNHDNFWEVMNRYDTLDLLICEVAFPNALEDLAKRAGHYSPQLLALDLVKLRHYPDIYISHTKPGKEDVIVSECREAVPTRTIHRLFGGTQFTL
ncbi:MAG TPA: 3',5'-cyclic-nucleotide phosphodiesterase [Gammaproteobacteria bacterium]